MFHESTLLRPQISVKCFGSTKQRQEWTSWININFCCDFSFIIEQEELPDHTVIQHRWNWVLGKMYGVDNLYICILFDLQSMDIKYSSPSIFYYMYIYIWFHVKPHFFHKKI